MNGTLSIIIWEVGKGQGLVSSTDGKETLSFMKKIENTAQAVGHRYCFWILADPAREAKIGSADSIKFVMAAAADFCLAKDIVGYSPVCKDEVWDEIQKVAVAEAVKDRPPRKELH